MKRQTEIIHQDDDGKWYFWDETQANREGPFDTEQEADEAFKRYAADILGLD